MPRHRSALPQPGDSSLFLTDGGLEAVLIFREGIELPNSAACEFLRSPVGRSVPRSYYDLRHVDAIGRALVGARAES